MRSSTLVAWILISCVKQLPCAFAEEVAAESPVRGRTPFVFRAILEDKPRMCVVALAPELWIAYDPVTCALERAFGGVEFHGKVYDFSQQNTRAKAPIWFEQPSLLLAVPGDVIPNDSVSTGVVAEGGLRFTTDGAEFLTPPFDPDRFTDVMVFFDEKSRRAPFRVELLVEGESEPRQWFRSTLHRDRDDAWQDNAKRLAVTVGSHRLRFVQLAATDEKLLRSIRVKGAYRAWSATADGSVTPVEPDWGGYVRSGPRGESSVEIRYSLLLSSGSRVAVTERPEVIEVDSEKAVLERRFGFGDLPPGVVLRLSLAGASHARGFHTQGHAELVHDRAGVVVEFRGDAILRQEWGRP